MELIIHFGVHKTGSSAIQNTLFSDPPPGIHYIHVGEPNSSLVILQGFCSDFKSFPNVSDKGYSDNDLAHIRQEARNSLRNAFNSAPKTSRKLVLSAESISQLTEDDLRDLADFVSEWADITTTTAIGYVRHPFDYIESAFQEALKSRLLNFSTHKFGFYYQRSIGKFARVFGPDNLRLFEYDTKAFPNQCVVTHFMREIGIVFSSESAIRSNWVHDVWCGIA